MLTGAEQARIAAAIREAESRTVGEIVVVMARQASAYRSLPLLYALLGALAAPWPLIWLTGLSAARIATIQLLVALALIVMFGVPKPRLASVPGFVKRARGREAAARAFLAHGLVHTRERTGVLIYVSAAEHYAEVVADEGIASRVDEEVWRVTIEELITAIRAGHVADGLAAAVERVGTILAEHAPRGAQDQDELPNKVIVM